MCFVLIPINHRVGHGTSGRLMLIQPKVQSDGTTLEVIGVRMPDVWAAQTGLLQGVVVDLKKEKSWFWFQILEEMDV